MEENAMGQAALAAPAFPSAKTAWSLLEEGEQPLLSTGCEELDRALGGGISPGLTEVAGEASCGKSQLLLRLVLQAQLPVEMGGLDGTSVYISSEGAPRVDRLRQMMKVLQRKHEWMKNFDFLEHIHMKCVDSVAEQRELVTRKLRVLLRAHPDIRVVVLDSVAALLRGELEVVSMKDRSKEIGSIGKNLHSIAADHPGLCVIVSNQVTDVMSMAGFDSDIAAPVGTLRHTMDGRVVIRSSDRWVTASLGIAWANYVQMRIYLSRQQLSNGTSRVMRVAYSSRVPDNSCSFVIDEGGVRADTSHYQEFIERTN